MGKNRRGGPKRRQAKINRAILHQISTKLFGEKENLLAEFEEKWQAEKHHQLQKLEKQSQKPTRTPVLRQLTAEEIVNQFKREKISSELKRQRLADFAVQLARE